MADAKTVKVTFTRSYIPDGADKPQFEEGESYDLRPDSAAHFCNRGMAVEGTPKAEPKAKPKDGDKPKGKPKDDGDKPKGKPKDDGDKEKTES